MPTPRAFPTLLTAATCAALAVAGSGVAQAKKKPSCPKGQEVSGCTLKKGAQYNAKLEGGGTALVVVEASSWYIGVVATGGSCNPRFDRASEDFSGGPKVGRSYAITYERRKNSGGGVIDAYDVSGKVRITSARKATFSGSYARQRTFRGQAGAPCQRSLAAKGDRTQP